MFSQSIPSINLSQIFGLILIHQSSRIWRFCTIPLDQQCISRVEFVSVKYKWINLKWLVLSEPKTAFHLHVFTFHLFSPQLYDKTLCNFGGYWSQFSSVQLLSHIWLSATPWIAAHQASLSITNSWSSLKLISIKSVMPSSHLILCRSLLLLPLLLHSIRVFSNESTLHIRWPKYWSFSFNISPSNEHPGLISFRMDWLDFLVYMRGKTQNSQHSIEEAQLWRTTATRLHNLI